MTSMFKKTTASVVMIMVFGAYSYYEHIHADSAGLFTLILNDLVAAQPDALATNSESDVPVQTNNGFSTGGGSLYQPTVNPSTQIPPPTPKPTPSPIRRYRSEDEREGEDDGFGSASINPTPTAKPAPTPAPAPAPTSAPTPTPPPPPPAPKGEYSDGSYTGPSVNVFYGYVQVQAIVQGGKLTDVKFLSYPNDRNTSRYINSQAMPLLIQEAIQAQSAQIDGVSGATDTSQGFIESLGSALSKAKA